MELIDHSDMSRGSLRRRGESLYYKFVESHMDEIAHNIKRYKEEYGNKDTYRIKEEDLRKMLDENIRDNDYRVIRRGLQLHFWEHNIVVFTEIRTSGKVSFHFRKKTRFDRPSPTELSKM